MAVFFYVSTEAEEITYCLDNEDRLFCFLVFQQNKTDSFLVDQWLLLLLIAQFKVKEQCGCK